MAPRTPLAGKTALVTGSTKGIGLAIAKRLLQDGAKVVVSSRKQANVDEALAELAAEVPGSRARMLGVSGHVGLAEDREALVVAAARFGGGAIDILVSNVAVNPSFGSILSTTESAWDKIFEVNVKAAFFLLKSTLKYMPEHSGSSVVFVASVAGFQPMNMLGAYSVSKTAILGLTKALVPALSDKGIRVNCVAPGVTKTKFAQALWDGPASKLALKQIPLARFGEPDNSAAAVAFLVSPGASYITGETMCVTGGMASRL